MSIGGRLVKLSLVGLGLGLGQVLSFLFPPTPKSLHRPTTGLYSKEDSNDNQISVYLAAQLSDAKIRSLYAWISCALNGEDERYGNLMLAMAAIFSENTPQELSMLVENAEQEFKKACAGVGNDEEDVCRGPPLSRIEREQHSLGAMGAGQWLGQYKTRPHAILNVENMTSIDDWIKSLPRGCKRTLKKADAQNFTIRTLPIRGRLPAPHSTLAHFRCVVEHEIRVIAGSRNYNETMTNVNDFFDALSESVGRFIGTTRMTGVIKEYRNQDNKVIAFAHEVQKGRTVRGQWFYATNEAAKNYVWFHSVKELVRRAIESDTIDTVDLGPSGSDSFSELKARYKFACVDDWQKVTDYHGPFWYEEDDDTDEENDDDRYMMMQLLRALGE